MRPTLYRLSQGSIKEMSVIIVPSCLVRGYIFGVDAIQCTMGISIKSENVNILRPPDGFSTSMGASPMRVNPKGCLENTS